MAVNTKVLLRSSSTSLICQRKSIGLNGALLTLCKIKVNVAHVGLSLQLHKWRVNTLFKVVNYLSFQNSNALTVMMSPLVAMVAGKTTACTMCKIMVESVLIRPILMLHFQTCVLPPIMVQ